MASGSRTRSVSISPLTHTIESYRNARMSWAGCLAELADNSLSPEKGDASRIHLDIRRHEVRVYDNGVGIDEVSRVLRPGDSGTWAGSADIGLYGVGATQALLWMGCRSEVHTVWEGRYSRAIVDWDALLRNRRSNKWEARVEDLGPVEQVNPLELPDEIRMEQRGTLLLAAKRVRGRRTPHTGDIRKSLERLFTPAPRSGREILFHSVARRETYSLNPLDPPTLSEPTKVAGEIGGKPYSGEVGVLDHADARVSGLWFGYQHRMIVRKGAADVPGLPSNVYGYIELGPEWRRSLSTFKDDISRDLEPLLGDIRGQIEDVIEQGLRWNKDLKVGWLQAQLEATLFKRTGSTPGRVEVHEESVSGRGDEGSSHSGGTKGMPESVEHPGQSPKQGAQTTGLRIESEPGRSPFVWTDIGASSVVVSFDPQHPHFAKSLSEPLDCPAFFGCVGASFANALAAKDVEQIVRVFPALRGRLLEDPTQRFPVILDEFTRRTASVRDRPTMAQIERDVRA